MADDWDLKAAWKAAKKQDDIGRLSMNVRQVVLEFASEVARRFPPGSPTKIRIPTVGWPPDRTDYPVVEATVCPTQVPRAELSDFGLLVEVDDETLPRIPEWRIQRFRAADGERKAVRVSFTELVEGDDG